MEFIVSLLEGTWENVLIGSTIHIVVIMSLCQIIEYTFSVQYSGAVAISNRPDWQVCLGLRITK